MMVNLFIEEVEKNGPADRAELQPGYLLSGIDGQNAGQLRRVGGILSEKKPGAQARLTVVVPRRLDALQATVDVEVR